MSRHFFRSKVNDTYFILISLSLSLSLSFFLDAPCITIPGIIRLILEWTLYALSFYAFLAISLHIGIPYRKILVCVYFGLVLLYYIVTYERVKWVLGQKDHPCKRRI